MDNISRIKIEAELEKVRQEKLDAMKCQDFFAELNLESVVEAYQVKINKLNDLENKIKQAQTDLQNIDEVVEIKEDNQPDAPFQLESDIIKVGFDVNPGKDQNPVNPNGISGICDPPSATFLKRHLRWDKELRRFEYE